MVTEFLDLHGYWALIALAGCNRKTGCYQQTLSISLFVDFLVQKFAGLASYSVHSSGVHFSVKQMCSSIILLFVAKSHRFWNSVLLYGDRRQHTSTTFHPQYFVYFQFATGYFQMMDLSVFILKLKAITAWNFTARYESSVVNLLPLDMKFNKVSVIALYQWD